MDEFTLKLSSPITDEQWDAITDVDFDNTNRVFFSTKHGKGVEFIKVVRCKDCKHRIVNEHYGEKGYFKVKATCELDTGDIFSLGRCAEDDNWFCADGERKGGADDADS